MVCVSFYFQVIIHKCLIAQIYVHQVDTCCPQGSGKDIRVSAAGVRDIWVLGEPWASTTVASTVNCPVISRAYLLSFNTAFTQTTRIIPEETFYNVLLSFPVASHFLSTYFVAVITDFCLCLACGLSGQAPLLLFTLACLSPSARCVVFILM